MFEPLLNAEDGSRSTFWWVFAVGAAVSGGVLDSMLLVPALERYLEPNPLIIVCGTFPRWAGLILLPIVLANLPPVLVVVAVSVLGGRSTPATAFGLVLTTVVVLLWWAVIAFAVAKRRRRMRAGASAGTAPRGTNDA